MVGLGRQSNVVRAVCDWLCRTAALAASANPTGLRIIDRAIPENSGSTNRLWETWALQARAALQVSGAL